MSRRNKANKSGKSRRKQRVRHDDIHPAQFPKGMAVIALFVMSGVLSFTIIMSIIGAVTGNG